MSGRYNRVTEHDGSFSSIDDDDDDGEYGIGRRVVDDNDDDEVFHTLDFAVYDDDDDPNNDHEILVQESIPVSIRSTCRRLACLVSFGMAAIAGGAVVVARKRSLVSSPTSPLSPPQPPASYDPQQQQQQQKATTSGSPVTEEEGSSPPQIPGEEEGVVDVVPSSIMGGSDEDIYNADDDDDEYDDEYDDGDNDEFQTTIPPPPAAEHLSVERRRQDLICMGDRWNNEIPLETGHVLCSHRGGYMLGMDMHGNFVSMDTSNNNETTTYHEGNPGNYFLLHDDATMAVYDVNGKLEWSKKSKPDVHFTPECLPPKYDCPYLHLHSGGVCVLNWIDDEELWRERRIQKVYGF